ncbi:hypothetical protein FOA52_010438 [Chlamydomonas sp. UWO 241]|nr:hypothetical protein FOA52_010438 [Chlamydomonas sp. UWO 241]
MEAVGVDDVVLAWTRTILTHTYASTDVNGLISAPRRYAAGVRQGCPAAPALFLFLRHALACFLRTCLAVGVEVVPGCGVVSPQYADNCMPLLGSCAPADGHSGHSRHSGRVFMAFLLAFLSCILSLIWACICVIATTVVVLAMTIAFVRIYAYAFES